MVVKQCTDRESLGRTAAHDVAEAIRSRLADQTQVRIIFACAPSQEATLRFLAVEPGIDWSRVAAFHMDEYLDLPPEAPQRFGNWLRRTLLDHVGCGEVHLLRPDAAGDPIADYAAALSAAPIDIVCLGIGVNGHLAFNDPPADLQDPEAVRIVQLSEESREQQVADGCFDDVDEVPTRAATLTVPRLLDAGELFCMVPGTSKRAAVTRTLHDPVSGDLPATALRTHPRCTLYVDAESAPDEV